MSFRLANWAVAVCLALAGCGSVSPEPSSSPATTTATTPTHTTAAPTRTLPSVTAAACHVRGQLPDPSCTPGDHTTATTQQVCTPGWARTHRSVSATVRRAVLLRYGNPSRPYELDHLIPLELGGSNRATNLWPEPGRLPNPKDAVENRLHARVCAGAMTLAEAQQRIAANWQTAA